MITQKEYQEDKDKAWKVLNNLNFAECHFYVNKKSLCWRSFIFNMKNSRKENDFKERTCKKCESELEKLKKTNNHD